MLNAERSEKMRKLCSLTPETLNCVDKCKTLVTAEGKCSVLSAQKKEKLALMGDQRKFHGGKKKKAT